jgi:TPR repeat protein
MRFSPRVRQRLVPAQAAEQGDAQAKPHLVEMYFAGLGVNADAGLDWYQKGRRTGDASPSLGLMYADGQGVASDDEEAGKWFRLAATAEDPAALNYLGMMYLEGRGVEKDEAEAAKLLQMGALHGDPQAQSTLGVMFRDGRGVKQDDAEAAHWFRSGAEHGNAIAQYNFGVSFAEGRGVTRTQGKRSNG